MNMDYFDICVSQETAVGPTYKLFLTLRSLQ